MVLLNPIAILLVMVPPFRRSLAHRFLPGSIIRTTCSRLRMPALGTVAELLGLYVLVVAATSILPKRLRFTRYRAWMRATLVLWWLSLAIIGFLMTSIGTNPWFPFIVGPLLKDSNPPG